MDVLMPQLGETVAEGKITKWFKSAGDAVKPGDNLFEIETDKVSMEVPSTTTGMLAEIRVGVGEVAPVGAVVAVIAGDGAAAQPAAAAAPPAPARAPAPAPAAAPAARPASARARRAARSIRSSKCARPSAISGPPVSAAISSRRWRDALHPRPASISAASRRPARTAASSRTISRRRPPRSRAQAPWRVVRRRRR